MPDTPKSGKRERAKLIEQIRRHREAQPKPESWERATDLVAEARIWASMDPALVEKLDREASRQKKSFLALLEEVLWNYLEEMDDAHEVVRRRSEKPVPWGTVKKRLARKG